MDEKRLANLRVSVSECSPVRGPSENTPPERLDLELIRLARLGLWAEKQGAPTLRDLKEAWNSGVPQERAHAWVIEALSHLPETK